MGLDRYTSTVNPNAEVDCCKIERRNGVNSVFASTRTFEINLGEQKYAAAAMNSIVASRN
jgi:phosphotransferase system IIB component